MPISSSGGCTRHAAPRRAARTSSSQIPRTTVVAAPVVEGQQQDHQPAGGHPAERPVALDQHRVGPLPRRRDGGRDARRAAADDQHVAVVDDRERRARARRRSRPSPGTPSSRRSTRMCLRTLPTLVRGSCSSNAMISGRLYAASAALQCARSASSVTPGLRHDHRRHALVADVVGEPDHGHVDDAVHAADHLLDLERREAQPGAPDDVAMAAHEVQEAVGVALDDVAGPEARRRAGATPSPSGSPK